MSANHKEKNRGIRVYLYKKDLEEFDLENAPLSLIQSYLKHGRESYHIESRIKDMEKFCSEISSKLDRFILLSSEIYSLVSQSSTIDQFEIEKLKFYQNKGQEISGDEKTMVAVSKDKEENFDIFLRKLFPEIKIGVLKLMKKHVDDA